MAKGRDLSHSSGAGHNDTAIGENIAAGYNNSTEVFKGWMGSTSHCKTIMNAAYTNMGVACRQKDGASPYWVMVLEGK